MSDEPKTGYTLGWDEGYAEGYACKLADATSFFRPQSLEVPEAIQAVAEHLHSRYRTAFPTISDALGCARSMFHVAKEALEDHDRYRQET